MIWVSSESWCKYCLTTNQSKTKLSKQLVIPGRIRKGLFFQSNNFFHKRQGEGGLRLLRAAERRVTPPRQNFTAQWKIRCGGSAFPFETARSGGHFCVKSPDKKLKPAENPEPHSWRPSWNIRQVKFGWRGNDYVFRQKSTPRREAVLF